ncbi:hypothetical protein BD626DRAFT_486335 [Schizophyllum amplum]|uniref:LYR motif-containing protein Cup1-like N-terminal domain-containing protein n=1 Tax=Schizophyllum amplum TaxID=97359 RepID=A0A550CMG7_9AGAR|nr:hypothetical protein BD626DRAFT_486335 [Auriculariopsis ampla]
MSVAALFRSSHRQIRRFPDSYLREFFLLKLKDDCRTILRTKGDEELRKRRMKRMSTECKRFQAANQRNVAAYDKILSTAYGRMGKLKYELMEPLLTDPSVPPPPLLIPEVQRSRPPSEEARIYGPLSKRREEGWAPLEVVADLRQDSVQSARGTTPDVLARAGVRGFGFQGIGLFAHVERMAGVPPKRPSYWLRRRYQILLSRLPVLTATRNQKGRIDGAPSQSVRVSGKTDATDTTSSSSTTTTSSSPSTPTRSRSADQMPDIGAEHLAWFDLAQAMVKTRAGKEGKQGKNGKNGKDRKDGKEGQKGKEVIKGKYAKTIREAENGLQEGLEGLKERLKGSTKGRLDATIMHD